MRIRRKHPADKWYDLLDDWDLIVSSFATQYNIRLAQETEMAWDEFCSLLKGIMPETPLGQIVSIRSEEDKDILKNFTTEHHKIRNEWRNRNNKIIEMTEEEKAEKIKEVQELFAKAFS
ncbi:MAG: bacteriophage Gp15 family protein [Bacillota bacterium]|nr:bacteriophage Gp15 family protein [Bacillota bacterium]